MGSLGTGFLLLAFMGITGLTIALVFYQHMKIKEFEPAAAGEGRG